jgi:Zn-finger nucleic acid-binding protein
MFCPRCRTPLVMREADGAVTEYCPTCLQAVTGDRAAAGPAAEDFADGSATQADKFATPDGPPDEDEEPDSRPASRTAGLARWLARHVLLHLIAFIFLLPCVGAGLIVKVCSDGPPRTGSAGEPRSLSYLELVGRGPDDNGYITLTDFQLDTGRRVTVGGSSDGDRWKKAWVPVVSMGGEGGPVRVLLETDRATTLTDLQRLQDDGRLPGELVRGIDSLKLWERVLLRRKHPGADLDRCWLLRHGKAPSSPLWTFGGIALGVVLILFGLPLWYVVWRLWRSN